MPVTASGLYITTWKNQTDGTDTVVDWLNDSVKCALYNNTLTPNFSTDTAYSVTNEISGGGYVAGGATLAGKTITESPTGTLRFMATPTTFTALTTTTVRAAILYDVTLSNKLLLLVNFVTDQTSGGGDFVITWPAAGIFTNDLTP